MREPRRGPLPTALRTVGTLALLQAVLPLNLAVTAVAALKAVLVPAPQEIAQHPRTILVSGGKMTKALLLARAFHRQATGSCWSSRARTGSPGTGSPVPSPVSASCRDPSRRTTPTRC